MCKGLQDQIINIYVSPPKISLKVFQKPIIFKSSMQNYVKSYRL